MLTPAQFAFFTTATNTMLGAVYDSTPVLYPRFSSTVPSDGDQNVYGWTGRTPKPRAWYGPRVVNEPAPQSIATIVEYMRGLTAEDGEPIGVTPSMILHPDSMLLEVDLILNRAFFANPTWGQVTGQVGAAENPMRQFKLEGVSWSLLDGDATTFYVLDTTKAYMPFTWQLREAPTLAQRTQENDPIVFDTHQFLWGYWMRGA